METTRALIWIICAATALVGLTAGASPAGAGLAAGAARVNITPSLSEFPTISLAGFGERQGKPAQSVRDDIYARALVLSDGAHKVALVATDLIGISPGMKDAVLRELAGLGFTDENVLLAAAHDHSAPECLHPGGDVWPLAFGKFHPEYFKWTVARIADSVRQANAHLQPAQIGFASAALEGFNRNRRETGAGLVDPTMTVIKVAQAGPASGVRTIALVVNFTAHPTIMGGSSFDISGEWPGAMCRALESELGYDQARSQGVAMFFNGAQGDQTHAGDFGSGWARVEAYGKALAGKAEALADGIQTQGGVKLAVRSLYWKLPAYRVSPAFIESTGQEYQLSPEQAAALASKLFPGSVRLQAVRLGDAVLMAVPGEAIAELGLAMKRDAAALGARYPMVIDLANDGIGYILSPEQYNLGGYESGTSFYGPQLGAILVSQMKETVRPLFARR